MTALLKPFITSDLCAKPPSAAEQSAGPEQFSSSLSGPAACAVKVVAGEQVFADDLGIPDFLDRRKVQG